MWVQGGMAETIAKKRLFFEKKNVKKNLENIVAIKPREHLQIAEARKDKPCFHAQAQLILRTILSTSPQVPFSCPPLIAW